MEKNVRYFFGLLVLALLFAGVANVALAQDNSKDRPELRAEIQNIREDLKNNSQVRSDLKEQAQNIREDLKNRTLNKTQLSDLKEKYKDLISESQVKRLAMLAANNTNTSELIKVLAPKQIQIYMNLPRAEQERIAAVFVQNGTDAAKKEISNYNLVTKNKDELYKMRTIAKNDMDNARAEFEKSKEKLQNINKNYATKLKEFNDAKRDLGNCKNSTSTACTGLNNKTVEKAREVVLDNADKVIENLNKLATKINSSENINSAEAASMVADIESAITKLNDAKQAASAATTKEQIKTAAQQINRIWTDIKSRQQVYSEYLVGKGLNSVITRSENLETKLETALANISAAGKDTTQLNAQISTFSAQVAKAKSEYQNATSLLAQAFAIAKDSTQASQVKTLTDSARENISAAEKDLKDAQTTLRQIMQSIRSAGGTIPASSQTETVAQQSDNNNALSE